jgi:hypothetical protein
MPVIMLLVLLFASGLFDFVSSDSGVMPPQDPPRGQECGRAREAATVGVASARTQ